MFLMYVDESGDCGMANSPTRHFILTGLVVHELAWEGVLQELVAFRRAMKSKYGLLMTDEIHTGEMTRNGGALTRIPRGDRLAIIRHFAECLGGIPSVRLLNVCADKQGKVPDFDVFEGAWRRLIQRFENTISYRNFPGSPNRHDKGMILPDNTDGKKLTRLVRRMRCYNPIPSQPSATGAGAPSYRNLVIQQVVEDPHMCDSRHSYFIQAADMAAYMLRQQYAPSKYMKKKGATAYFRKLEPILLKQASSKNPFGIVEF